MTSEASHTHTCICQSDIYNTRGVYLKRDKHTEQFLPHPKSSNLQTTHWYCCPCLDVTMIFSFSWISYHPYQNQMKTKRMQLKWSSLYLSHCPLKALSSRFFLASCCCSQTLTLTHSSLPSHVDYFWRSFFHSMISAYFGAQQSPQHDISSQFRHRHPSTALCSATSWHGHGHQKSTHQNSNQNP